MKIRIPNILTIGRIIIVPIFVISFFLPGFFGDLIPFFLFVLASFTDYLDGLLARLFKEESKLGELLDPIADKILVSAALILLVMNGTIKNFEVIAAIIILTREILISGLREFLAKVSIAMLTLARNSLKPEINISLVKIIIAAITSKFLIVPFITSKIKAAETNILSAIGSSNSPNFDSSLNNLANNPSR